jgi:F0F1-type ATP synthase membrane subunit c/vacuolar-type H+-ATPase subunit K
MMNRPSNQRGADAGLETRLRTLRILWAVFLMNVGLFALFGVFSLRSGDAAEGGADDPTLLAAMAVVACLSVAVSFLIKGRFYRQAAERGEPARAQQGLIVALVLCEVSALLGLVGLLLTLNEYAYGLFALGALGQLLHFPRRDELAAAYRKGLR